MTRRREDIDRLNELEELFADLWQVPRFAAGLRRAHRPQLDVFVARERNELIVVVELAGADPDQIQIVLEGRHLVIAGERPRPRCEGARFYRSEIEYGPFQREVPLPEDVDVAGTYAHYDRGLLRITLPVATRPRAAQKVPIEVRRGE